LNQDRYDSAIGDDLTPFDEGTERLEPVFVPVPGTVETVFSALQFFAMRSANHRLGAQWLAFRHQHQPVLVLVLKEGPLVGMRLRISADCAEAADGGFTALWITGKYTARGSLLGGVFGRHGALRDALALRQEVLSMLEKLWTNNVDHYRRHTERYPLAAAAKLFVAQRSWRAEALNVSDGGLSVIVVTSSSTAQSDAAFLSVASEGELELHSRTSTRRANVVIRNVMRSRGGIRLGLEVHDRGVIDSLLQQALAREQARIPEIPAESDLDQTEPAWLSAMPALMDQV
jgi:hypothetical protein